MVRGARRDPRGQLARIIADGVARGEFAAADPAAAGRAVFDATARFHNPAHAAEWSDPGIDAAFEGVWSLILAALGPKMSTMTEGEQVEIGADAGTTSTSSSGAGPLGLAVARHLAARGNRVRVAHRQGRDDLPEGVEVVRADVAVAADANARAMERRRLSLRQSVLREVAAAASAAHGRDHRGGGVGRGETRVRRQPIRVRTGGRSAHRRPALPGDGPERAHAGTDRGDAHASPRSGPDPGDDRARIRLLGPHRTHVGRGDRVFARALEGKPARSWVTLTCPTP